MFRHQLDGTLRGQNDDSGFGELGSGICDVGVKRESVKGNHVQLVSTDGEEALGTYVSWV